MNAELEAADGVDKTPFVTLRMTPTEEGGGNIDALQVTLQAMDMVAEGALEVDPKTRSACAVVSFVRARVLLKQRPTIKFRSIILAFLL